MKQPLPPSQAAFIQIGELAASIIRISEIVTISRELMEVTDEKRDRYRGYITPDGKAYVLIVRLKDGRTLTYKCVTEEHQDKMFENVSSVLGTHLIEYPAGMAEAAQNMREDQQQVVS